MKPDTPNAERTQRSAFFDALLKYATNARLLKSPSGTLLFFAGSLVAALSQGFMLGSYIVGLEWTATNAIFATLIAPCLAAFYVLIGACWVILKSEGELRRRATSWAQIAIWGAAAGMAAVSFTTPLASDRLAEKWLSFPSITYLWVLPVLAIGTFYALWWVLQKIEQKPDRLNVLPLGLCVGLFVTGFTGMAYSFYPYIVPGVKTIAETAAYEGSLIIILAGVSVVLPIIILYTAFSYWVFRGKATKLSYGSIEQHP